MWFTTFWGSGHEIPRQGQEHNPCLQDANEGLWPQRQSQGHLGPASKSQDLSRQSSQTKRTQRAEQAVSRGILPQSQIRRCHTVISCSSIQGWRANSVRQPAVPSGERCTNPSSSERKLPSNVNCEPGDHPDGAFENIKHKYDAWDLLKRIVDSNKGTKNWYAGYPGKDKQHSTTDKQIKIIAFQQLLEHHQKLQPTKVKLWAGIQPRI